MDFQQAFIYAGKIWYEINYWSPFSRRGRRSQLIVSRREHQIFYRIRPYDLFIPLENFIAEKDIDAISSNSYIQNSEILTDIGYQINQQHNIKNTYYPIRSLAYQMDPLLPRPGIIKTHHRIPITFPAVTIIVHKDLGWTTDDWLILQEFITHKTKFRTIFCGSKRELMDLNLHIHDSLYTDCDYRIRLSLLGHILKYSAFSISFAHGSAALALLVRGLNLIYGPEQYRKRYTELFNRKLNPVIYHPITHPYGVQDSVSSLLQTRVYKDRLAVLLSHLESHPLMDNVQNQSYQSR